MRTDLSAVSSQFMKIGRWRCASCWLGLQRCGVRLFNAPVASDGVAVRCEQVCSSGVGMGKVDWLSDGPVGVRVRYPESCSAPPLQGELAVGVRI